MGRRKKAVVDSYPVMTRAMGASAKVVAGFVAHDFFKAHPELPAGALQQELALRMETALRAALRQERESCASVCYSRQDLWLSTEGRASTPAQLRLEARARANEAAYLADAIRAK